VRIGVAIEAPTALQVADTIYHNCQVAPNGTWTGDEWIGGKAKKLAIAPNADGRLDLPYIGIDDALYHRWQPWLGDAAPSAGAKNSRSEAWRRS
jgi:hypothetical protein